MDGTTWIRMGGIACMLACVSCQQHQLSASGGKLAYRNYPDSVTNINAVDPAYRSYFTGQHGSNYSLADQRKAFAAATQTARTPVQSDARHARTAPSAGRKAVASSRKASAKKGTGRKAVAKRTPAKKKAVAAKRPAKRKR